MSLIFATQLTAVATASLVVLALAAAIVAGIALRKQSRELAILVADSSRQADERRRAQALSVFTGVPLNHGHHLVQPYAENASAYPVFDAQFWYTHDTGLSGHDDLGLIMPGPEAPNGRQMSAAEALEHTILTFRDANGVRWIRLPGGTLREQTRPTAHDSVLAALGLPEPAQPAGA